MTPAQARFLTRLYPRSWRERYGEEFEAFLVDGSGGFDAGIGTELRTAANVFRSAISEHFHPTRGGNMNPNPNSFDAITRQPSAYLPLAMSLTALTMVACAVTYGVIHDGRIVHEADEGTVAHLWQILMAGQMPIIGFFAIKWLPRAPKQTISILALQAAAVLASMAPVYFLHF